MFHRHALPWLVLSTLLVAATPAAAQVNDDWMFDIEIPSNRPDCLGHIGLARELAAATSAAFNLPNVDFAETAKSVNDITSVQNDQPDLCARYTARVIEEIRVADSPGWMKKRLETDGC